MQTIVQDAIDSAARSAGSTHRTRLVHGLQPSLGIDMFAPPPTQDRHGYRHGATVVRMNRTALGGDRPVSIERSAMDPRGDKQRKDQLVEDIRQRNPYMQNTNDRRNHAQPTNSIVSAFTGMLFADPQDPRATPVFVAPIVDGALANSMHTRATRNLIGAQAAQLERDYKDRRDRMCYPSARDGCRTGKSKTMDATPPMQLETLFASNKRAREENQQLMLLPGDVPQSVLLPNARLSGITALDADQLQAMNMGSASKRRARRGAGEAGGVFQKDMMVNSAANYIWGEQMDKRNTPYGEGTQFTREASRLMFERAMDPTSTGTAARGAAGHSVGAALMIGQKERMQQYASANSLSNSDPAKLQRMHAGMVLPGDMQQSERARQVPTAYKMLMRGRPTPQWGATQAQSVAALTPNDALRDPSVVRVNINDRGATPGMYRNAKQRLANTRAFMIPGLDGSTVINASHGAEDPRGVNFRTGGAGLGPQDRIDLLINTPFRSQSMAKASNRSGPQMQQAWNATPESHARVSARVNLDRWAGQPADGQSIGDFLMQKSVDNGQRQYVGGMGPGRVGGFAKRVPFWGAAQLPEDVPANSVLGY